MADRYVRDLPLGARLVDQALELRLGHRLVRPYFEVADCPAVLVVADDVERREAAVPGTRQDAGRVVGVTHFQQPRAADAQPKLRRVVVREV